MVDIFSGSSAPCLSTKSGELQREFFFTPRITSWTQVFQYSIPWETLLENQLWLAGANFTLIMIAVAIVESRDFKS
jgi:hypothetical protein